MLRDLGDWLVDGSLGNFSSASAFALRLPALAPAPAPARLWERLQSPEPRSGAALFCCLLEALSATL